MNIEMKNNKITTGKKEKIDAVRYDFFRCS